MAFKGKGHVHVPCTTTVACGQQGYSFTPMYREQITCKRCRKHPLFKTLPNLPKKKSK